MSKCKNLSNQVSTSSLHFPGVPSGHGQRVRQDAHLPHFSQIHLPVEREIQP